MGSQAPPRINPVMAPPCCTAEVADTYEIGKQAAGRLNQQKRERSRDKKREERREKKAEYFRDDAAQALLQPGSECGDQQDGYDAAASRCECCGVHGNRSESGMTEKTSEDTAEDRRSTEGFRGLNADKKVHAPEYDIAGDAGKLYPGRCGHFRPGF